MNTRINRINPATGAIELQAVYTNSETIAENAALYLASLCNFHNWWDTARMERYRQAVTTTKHGNAVFQHNGIDYIAIEVKPKKPGKIHVFCMNETGHIVGGLATTNERTAADYMQRKNNAGLVTIKTVTK